MSALHLLKVWTNKVNDNPIHSDGTLTIEVVCPEVTDTCRAYVECQDKACSVEKLEDIYETEGDDEPTLHGVTHVRLDYGFGTALDYCMVRNSDVLYDVAEELVRDKNLETGAYVVEHEWEEGNLERLTLSAKPWPNPTNWFDIDPKDAVELDLSKRPDITAPLNEMGERCPWPWGPEQLKGVPLGQYHCEYCGAMSAAGVRHPDYAGFDLDAELEQYYRDNPEKDGPIDLSVDPFGEPPK